MDLTKVERLKTCLTYVSFYDSLPDNLKELYKEDYLGILLELKEAIVEIRRNNR